MKKFLLHIVSLLICLSFVFQTSFAQVVNLDTTIEVEDVNDLEVEEIVLNIKSANQKIEQYFIVDKQQLFTSDYATIASYETTFSRSSYFQLYKHHNSYLL